MYVYIFNAFISVTGIPEIARRYLRGVSSIDQFWVPGTTHPPMDDDDRPNDDGWKPLRALENPSTSSLTSTLQYTYYYT